MVCMSTSPFDSGSILKWFSSALSDEANVCDVLNGKSAMNVEEKDSISAFSGLCPIGSNQVSTTIPVMIGSDIAELSVPIDLLCSLLLTKSAATVTPPSTTSYYTLEDIMEASENLKRFRDVAGSITTTGSSHSTSTRESTPILPTPVPPAMTRSPSVDIVAMSLDANGAIVVQEMLGKANEVEKDLIFGQLMENSLAVSVNTHGCRVIQRVLEYGTPEQNYRLFKSLPYYKVSDLCMDVNGNHVMQKFVEVLPQYALREIIDLLVNDSMSSHTICRLCLHSYGCRVIQRLLVKVSNPDDRSVLLRFVLEIFSQLVVDQFGNYVAQHAIDYSTDDEKVLILEALGGMDILNLCCNKYASNVIEKGVRIRYTRGGTTSAILVSLHKLIASIVRDEEGLLCLMKDKYGNYVVKAICDLSPHDFPQVTYVKEVLIHNANVLKSYTYGFHLVEKIEKSMIRRERFGSSTSSNGQQL